jgi:hypothetical protein
VLARWHWSGIFVTVMALAIGDLIGGDIGITKGYLLEGESAVLSGGALGFASLMIAVAAAQNKTLAQHNVALMRENLTLKDQLAALTGKEPS